ncbi:MAG: hypothetical protein JWM98_1777 [Thermoleophilia bacterium]|nr:hypothetical protein [Thermoleophilia bacterium]
MAYPVYVLLPDGAEWTEVPGTRAQSPGSVRWYLRQSMPRAATQVAVMVAGEDAELARRIDEVVQQAEALGGVAVDGPTQERIEHGASSPVA